MGSRTIPLLVDEQVTLDANGNGQVELKPGRYGESWRVRIIATKVDPRPPTNEPEFTAYQDGRFIGGSYSGSMDSDSALDLFLQAGQGVQGVWVGGDAGATATMTIQGTQTIEGG